jgi:DNA-binding transcriptional MerR regulator
MTDQELTKRRMDEEQALGFLLLACKQLGYSLDQVQQIHSSMNLQFNKHSPDVAKKEGEKWLNFIRKSHQRNDCSNMKIDRTKKKYKRASVRIPKISENNRSRKLREENERIVRELNRMEDGPFGLFKLIRKCRGDRE